MSKLKESSLVLDPSADVLHYDVRGLDAIISPKSVAIIGATEKAGSVGRTIVWNLLSSPFGGTVFPVNPKRANILGIKAYPTIGEVPDQVDLAVIVTPAATVPGIIAECVAAGVKGAIIISAGFKETGAGGRGAGAAGAGRGAARPHARGGTQLPGRDEPL